jgi:CubicO group peptidase (beta-lactamase class C family)
LQALQLFFDAMVAGGASLACRPTIELNRGETSMPMIQGWCDPAFNAVRDAFEASFSGSLADQDREHGAAITAIVDDRMVVDLWGGWADKAGTRPWTRDTAGVVMSQTKGWTGILVHSLAEAGLVNLDKPIAEIWPGFAANDKEAITMAHVLDHSAGVPFVRVGTRELGFDQARWERAIEDAPALHAPGVRHIYHPLTYGYICAGVVRRATGKDISEILMEKLTGPLGLDLTYGAARGRVMSESSMVSSSKGFELPLPLAVEAIVQAADPLDWSDPHVLGATIPAGNGVGTARDIARFWASLISAAAPLSKEALARVTTQRWQGTEEMTGAEWRMGLGLMLSNPFADFGPNALAFGHPGAGGVAGFVDPDRRLAVGYLPNKPYMRPGTGERGPRLTRAILEAIG